MNEIMEGRKLVGDRAGGRSMDKGVRGGRLLVDAKSELAGGNRDGEVQEVNLGASYFDRELYGQVAPIYNTTRM